MINTDLENASKIMIGSLEAEAIYVGSNLIWNSLPYDSEIEYLAANGSTLYIDTEYVPQGGNISFEFKFRLNKFNDNNEWTSLFTAYTSENHSTFRIIRNSNNSDSLLICCGQQAGGNGVIANNISLGTDHIISANALNVVVDNILNISLLNIESIPLNTNSLKLFSANSVRSIDLYIYYLKIWDNDNLVLDIIPVRIGLTGYMYDKVNGLLFGNEGTGDFVLGPDKS